MILDRYRALGFFNDGRFYLLDVPDHTAGRMAALVRTTPSTFMFLGGDTCHHAAEFRPTAYLPLSEHISGQHYPSTHISACPCSFFEQLHPKRSRTEPFYTMAVAPTGESLATNVEETLESIVKLEEFDDNENVFTVIAQDFFLVGVVDMFPATANAWKEKGWAGKER